MNSTLKQLSMVLAVGALITLNSCKKENNDDEMGQDLATADNIFTESQNIADEAALNGTVSFKDGDASEIAGGCAIITRDTISSPRTVTIDFGNGCAGNDGKLRKGKILVSYTGKYRDAGTAITINFNGYSVNGNLVDDASEKTIVNNGINNSGNMTWSITANGTIYLSNNRGTVTWSSSRVREIITGSATAIISDDIYLITGTAACTTPKGGSFTANIITPLKKDFLCSAAKRHFTEGIIEIKPQTKPTRTLDFGDGTCDNTASLTVNGNTRTINL